MVPYCASFQPALPHYFIRKHTNPGDTVYDPFSGRGTTALEACLLGRHGVGSDISMLSYVLTSAKVRRTNISDIESLIVRLKSEYDGDAGKKHVPDVDGYVGDTRYADILSAYEHGYGTKIFYTTTLHQMSFIRDSLLSNASREATFLKAVMCGICVGHSNVALSVPTTGGLCKHPGHFRRKRIDNPPPRRDVFQCMYEYSKKFAPYMAIPVEGDVYRSDATKSPLEPESVDLVVTSPPYLDLINYFEKNWIRHWIVGEAKEEAKDSIFVTSKIKEYTEFVASNLKELYRVLKPDRAAIYVVGDYHGIIDRLVSSARTVGFSCNTVIMDRLSDHMRAHRQVGVGGVSDASGGTKYNLCAVLEKGRARVNRSVAFRWEHKYHDVKQKTLASW
jgi:hypothetical protein